MGALLLVVLAMLLLAGAYKLLLWVVLIGSVFFIRPAMQDVAAWRRSRSPCALCGEPNRRAHGCHAQAIARVIGHGPTVFSRRWGTFTPARWRGVVIDGWGTAWECTHIHRRRDALRCAARHLSQHQVSRCECFQIGQRAPRGKGRVPRRRLPISDLSDADWAKMCAAAEHRCHYCGKKSLPLHKEHRIPLARGGANSISNIVPACSSCNLKKGTLTDEEFHAKLAETGRRMRRQS